MKNWAEQTVGRRDLFKYAAALGPGLLLPFADYRTIHGKEIPYVITGHGINGSSTSGIIGSLNGFLRQNDIPFAGLDLPGGMNPDREVWKDQIHQAIIRSPKPPKLLLYSLSGLPGLEAASLPDSQLDSLATLSIRKIKPSLPIDFPWHLADFYLNSNVRVDIPQLIENTPNGRLVTHSEDDGVVWFQGNAPELVDQIKADRFFVNGMGHFDQPLSKGIFEQIARKIVGI